MRVVEKWRSGLEKNCGFRVIALLESSYIENVHNLIVLEQDFPLHSSHIKLPHAIATSMYTFALFQRREVNQQGSLIKRNFSSNRNNPLEKKFATCFE